MFQILLSTFLLNVLVCCSSAAHHETSANVITEPLPVTNKAPGPLPEENIMDENTLNILQTSEDQKELLRSAMALARSKQEGDHKTLLDFLSRPAFLSRLDTPKDYQNATAKRLKIAQILAALAENDAPSARAVFVALTKDANFLKEGIRVDYLIGYSANLRAEAPQLIDFWDKYSKPEDGFTNLTVRALVKNGTAAAMEVLEKKMADPEHDDDDKIAWMRVVFVPNRDDYELLRSFERMLTGKLPERLRPLLVEIIFDYKPGEWYRPATTANPPDRSKIGQREREQLRRVGQIALQIPNLTEEQRNAVEKTLRDIG